MGDSSSSTGSLLTEFCIPEYILDPNSDREKCSASPEYPVLVFINSKSGGQLGGDLLRTYRQLLRECQVSLSLKIRKLFVFASFSGVSGASFT